MAPSFPHASSNAPLPLSTVKSDLGDVYINKTGTVLPPGIEEGLSRMEEKAKNNVGATRESRAFVENNNKLAQKCVEVPAGVMIQGQKARLVDIRVNAKGKPDDTVYRKNKDIRELIPRGFTVLEIEGREDTTVIFGFKKFSGGIGDEDENQPETNDQWREYCTADPETATKMVCITKLNGEAAHFSGRYIDGQFYLFVGSKNVHMMVRNRADINLYTGDRYFFAKVIAETVYDSLCELEEDKQHLLFSFLHHTNCTVVCEILQPKNQHIVNLSHLSKPRLQVISFTPTVSGSSPGASLTALPPHHLLDIAKVLGLDTASYTIIDFAKFMEQRKKIRSMTQEEGEVWYLLNDKNTTIGLIKVKTAWYTVLRALREKAVFCFTTAKKKSDWNLQDRIKSTHKRFKEIQNWLKFSNDYLQQWKVLGEDFLTWLNNDIKNEIIDPKIIRPMFPVVWKRFLDSTNHTDEIALT
ncbi:hypothetical protein Pmani_020678 [Petrolisthes manimaculis]|uniref:DUF7920 domain-containing protein n=1 Tax=Petrolisthes manimaculis TaxID=1843537 RepID=A0AAE1PG76_9EUCA|nr:hypothetical protein Pmani_020678 [Petrolisthes manimaculis]